MTPVVLLALGAAAAARNGLQHVATAAAGKCDCVTSEKCTCCEKLDTTVIPLNVTLCAGATFDPKTALLDAYMTLNGNQLLEQVRTFGPRVRCARARELSRPAKRRPPARPLLPPLRHPAFHLGGWKRIGIGVQSRESHAWHPRWCSTPLCMEWCTLLFHSCDFELGVLPDRVTCGPEDGSVALPPSQTGHVQSLRS